MTSLVSRRCGAHVDCPHPAVAVLHIADRSVDVCVLHRGVLDELTRYVRTTLVKGRPDVVTIAGVCGPRAFEEHLTALWRMRR